MSDWPLATGGRFVETTTTNAGTSKGVLVEADASANTKGAWIELIASTSYNSTNFIFIVQSYGAEVSVEYLVDIAIGAASSEQVIVENLQMSFNSIMYRNGRQYIIPINIPTGTRISCRCQSSDTATPNVVVSALLCSDTFLAPRSINKIFTYGAVTADSGGTEIDPGAVANTKGSWVELVANTSLQLQYLSIAIGNRDNSARTDMYGLLDIGIGAGSSEQVVLSNIPIACNSNGDLMGPPFIGPVMFDIPEGSRIAVRAQCDITDATDRLFDIVLYGGA